MWSILLAALTVAPANAQDVQDYTVDFEQFRPYTDAYGYFGVPSAATLGHLQVGVSYWLNYANDPLILVYEGERTAPTSAMVIGDDGDGIVDDRVTGNLQVGMGMSRYFSSCAWWNWVLRGEIASKSRSEKHATYRKGHQ